MVLESVSSMCAFGKGDTEWFLDVIGCVQKRRTGLFLFDWSDSEWELAGWPRHSSSVLKMIGKERRASGRQCLKYNKLY